MKRTDKVHQLSGLPRKALTRCRDIIRFRLFTSSSLFTLYSFSIINPLIASQAMLASGAHSHSHIIYEDDMPLYTCLTSRAASHPHTLPALTRSRYAFPILTCILNPFYVIVEQKV